MKVIKPNALTSADVTVIGLSAYPVWDLITLPEDGLRQVGEIVEYGYFNYECLIAHQKAYRTSFMLFGITYYTSDWILQYPPSDFPEFWRKLGVTNSTCSLSPTSTEYLNYVATYGEAPTWNFLRPTTTDKTVAETQLYVKINAGAVNSLGLAGLEGDLLEIAVRDSGGGIYGYTQYNLKSISSWSEYYAQDSVQITEVAITGLTAGNGLFLEVYINSSLGNAGLSTLVAGNFVDLGPTEYGVTLGIEDYSKKTTDDFGTTVFVERNYTKKVSANMLITNAQFYKVQSLLSSLRAKPTFWIATEEVDLQALTVYGWAKDWSLTVSYPTQSYCSLEIEGLA